MERRRIAVIGSGVAGLTAAYVLGRRDDVTLFEADDRIGGHAHTHDVASADGRTLAVDSGFIVHNERTYPRLVRLFAELGVRTQPSDMSMSVSCGGCGLEYAGGKGAPGLFARVSSLARAPYLRMLAEVPRFHRMAREALEHGDDRTLGEFVAGFSPYFIAHFTTPLVSAVWSCPPSDAGRYPARYLFAFLANHGMLTVSGSPRWRTVTGGSREYVEKIAKTLTAVHTSTPVRALRRTGEGVELQADGVQRFDAAVVATHPDQALRLLAEPTPGEREVLGAFRYSRNPVTLHTDPSVLPRARRARASWNYRMESCTADAAGARVTYDMNRLQRLEASRPHLVTLGAEIPDGHAIARMTYEHPVYTPESVAAQERLPALDDDVIAYAGAYHGWGFHEDGCGSGVRAAEALGGAVVTALYECVITHVRSEPIRNDFSYGSYLWLVDLDRLPRNRPLAAFHARDHAGDPALSIRQNVDAFLAGRGITAGRITMLANARVLGHVFNPLTVYWCDTGDGTAVVAEVHNTYGGRHSYLLRPGEREVAKEFRVSPFNAVEGHYRLSLPEPGERLALTVVLHRPGRPPFVAGVRGRRRPATGPWLWRMAARHPMAPLVGSARIRRQGIGLYLRGLRTVPPEGPR